MANAETEFMSGIADKRRLPSSATTLLATPANYAGVSALRTRLAAISGTTYTAAVMDKMTKNDMFYAVRNSDDAARLYMTFMGTPRAGFLTRARPRPQMPIQVGTSTRPAGAGYPAMAPGGGTRFPGGSPGQAGGTRAGGGQPGDFPGVSTRPPGAGFPAMRPGGGFRGGFPPAPQPGGGFPAGAPGGGLRRLSGLPPGVGLGNSDIDRVALLARLKMLMSHRSGRYPTPPPPGHGIRAEPGGVVPRRLPIDRPRY